MSTLNSIPDHCEYPGCKSHLAISNKPTSKHHIKPKRENGPGNTLNLIRLCPDHHVLADMEAEGYDRETLWRITLEREIAYALWLVERLRASASKKWNPKAKPPNDHTSDHTPAEAD